MAERGYLNATIWRRADARRELLRFADEHWELSGPCELSADEFNRHLQALVRARNRPERAGNDPGRQNPRVRKRHLPHSDPRRLGAFRRLATADGGHDDVRAAAAPAGPASSVNGRSLAWKHPSGGAVPGRERIDAPAAVVKKVRGRAEMRETALKGAVNRMWFWGSS